MKIAVAITNHNQNHIIKDTVELLSQQTVLPEKILICSDDAQFKSKNPLVININNKNKKGRCLNRNSAVEYFLTTDCDAIIFMDGDSYPKDFDYIENYIRLFKKYDLVFGTRQHTTISKITKPASDLLTANMDELWQGTPLNYTDLRVVSKAVESWQAATTFAERSDLLITGMIGWSCNFGFTRKGLETHLKFMQDTYGKKELFDSNAFSGNWGYEDVAMSIDALYAGLNIWIDESIEIMHKSHERTDGLFDHVKGRHLIMDRYRALESNKDLKSKVYTALIVLFYVYMAGVITGLITMSMSLE